MNIEDIDERQKRILLKITNMDDLWFLNNFLEKGDIVFGTIFRKEDERQDTVRSKKSERIRIRVGIEIEYSEFQEFSNRLRVHGIIRIGPEDYLGFHQSINIEPGTELEIIKKVWKEFYIDELRKAEDSGKSAIFVAIDDEEATVALLRDYAIQVIAEIRLKKYSKDMDEKEGPVNYDEILAKIKQYITGDMPVIVLGPGFFKENFLKHIGNDEIRKRLIVVNTSYAGERGIYEALKSGMLEQLLRQSRMKLEIDLVTQLLDEIGKNGKYAYGIEEVRKAMEFGAIEKLLVSDSKIRNGEIEEIMRNAQEQGAEIHIISSHHEYGRILENLGGIAAILRFQLPNRP